MEFDINGFINTENPDRSICREERQYAALLYDILLKAKKEKSDSETKNIVTKLIGEEYDNIEHVFFEATLMRDYFIKDKSGFNEKLIDYCFKDNCKMIKDKIDSQNEPFNFGSSSKTLKKIRNDLSDLDDCFAKGFAKARYMMNAKPDIMVIFTFKENVYAKSLECKYTSPESHYENGVSQTFIQNDIMKFLFDRKIIKYGNKDIISKGSVILDFKDKICEDNIDSRIKYFVDKAY